MSPKDDSKSTLVTGLAAIGLLLVGFSGLGHAFLYGAALSLVASALAFGILLYVSFR